MPSRELLFMLPSPAPAILPLGVYRAPWTINGGPILVAIDARGELVQWKPAAGEQEVEHVAAHLWDVLDLEISATFAARNTGSV